MSRPLAGAGEWLLLPAPGSEGLNTAKLRIVRGGVLAGSVLKKRFQPAHALFMAYGADCTNREELTLADPRTAAWLRGEEIDAATAQNGWGQGQRRAHQKSLPKRAAQPAIKRTAPLEKHGLLWYTILMVIIGFTAVAL